MDFRDRQKITYPRLLKRVTGGYYKFWYLEYLLPNSKDERPIIMSNWGELDPDLNPSTLRNKGRVKKQYQSIYLMKNNHIYIKHWQELRLDYLRKKGLQRCKTFYNQRLKEDWFVEENSGDMSLFDDIYRYTCISYNKRVVAVLNVTDKLECDAFVKSIGYDSEHCEFRKLKELKHLNSKNSTKAQSKGNIWLKV